MMRIVKLVRYRTVLKDGPNYNKTAIGEINEDTYKLLKERYVVLRNVIPKDIIEFAMDVWKTIEHQPNLEREVFTKEDSPIPDSPVNSRNKTLGGHTTPMGVAIHKYVHKRLTSLLDLELNHTYSYTRRYERGSYLRAHSDRPSCEISGTLCLDYATDDQEPWVIWVDNSRNWINISNNGSQDDLFDMTQGISQRKRTGTPIKLEPGDVLLYQGPNVVHWRDYLVGDYSYHMFIHFYSNNTRMQDVGGDGGAFFYGIENSVKSRGALENDGRPNAYCQKRDCENSEEARQFDEWMKLYDAEEDKIPFTNNYEEFEFEPIE